MRRTALQGTSFYQISDGSIFLLLKCIQRNWLLLATSMVVWVCWTRAGFATPGAGTGMWETEFTGPFWTIPKAIWMAQDLWHRPGCPDSSSHCMALSTASPITSGIALFSSLPWSPHLARGDNTSLPHQVIGKISLSSFFEVLRCYGRCIMRQTER